MLEIQDESYFQGVRKWAEENGKLGCLQDKLDYLGSFSCPENDKTLTKCVLYKDFAPQSFGFTMFKKDRETGEYKRWFNGGMIYYGAGDTGVGAPQLSVRIGDSSQSGWQINT